VSKLSDVVNAIIIIIIIITGPDFAGGGPGPTLRMEWIIINYSLEQWVT